ncbi:hypothetical protein J2125_003771 [Erwinia toletana]|uniref:Uncharacterized protein n=1 Tax=Winslowiella toletana TaxID=92490 RepID=A0ABS4PD74_9GAMM|nr:hypothetical protein [Winslowiella toletana]
MKRRVYRAFFIIYTQILHINAFNGILLLASGQKNDNENRSLTDEKSVTRRFTCQCRL